jgi:hypothetical protein
VSSRERNALDTSTGELQAVGRVRSRGLIVVVVFGMLVLAPGMASADSSFFPVIMKFDGTGTFTATNGAQTDSPEHVEDALKWSVTYIGKLGQDGSVTFQPSGGSSEVGITTGPPPGTYRFTDSGNFKSDCSGTLPLSPGAPASVASVSGGKLTVQSITSLDQMNATHHFDGCQGTDSNGLTQDQSDQAANLAGAMQPNLPDVLAAKIDLPADALKSGTFTKSVSDSDAPTQLPASCASQFGWPDPGQCQMTLNWTGTIRIDVLCGQVTFSEGTAPPVGTVVARGQTITTGPKSRLELTLGDGSVMRLGPSSTFVCNLASGDRTDEPGMTFKLLLGLIWSKIATENYGKDCFSYDANGSRIAVECPDAAPGVRGAADAASVSGQAQPSFTLDTTRGLFHVISGFHASVRVGNHPPLPVAAGETARITRAGATIVTQWPSADQALVPAALLPPKLSGVRAAGAAGAPPILSLRLSQPAKLAIVVRRGGRKVLSLIASARKGTTRINLRRSLPAGSYTVQVTAVRQGLASIVTAQLRVG